MLEDPSEIDDIANELRSTPINQQSEGSLKLYVDQLSLAEGALKLLIDEEGDPEGHTESKRQCSRDLRGQINAEIDKRIAARGEAGMGKKPKAVPFTDDVARDRYGAGGGNWASEHGAISEQAAPKYSRHALLWTAIIAFSIGMLIRRR